MKVFGFISVIRCFRQWFWPLPLDLDLDLRGSPESLNTRQRHQLMHPFVFIRFWCIPCICAGIIYDVIVEPPSIGSTTDERGNSKPVSTRGLWSIYWLQNLESSSKFVLGSHSEGTEFRTVTLQAKISFSLGSSVSVSQFQWTCLYLRQQTLDLYDCIFFFKVNFILVQHLCWLV